MRSFFGSGRVRRARSQRVNVEPLEPRGLLSEGSVVQTGAFVPVPGDIGSR